MNTDEQKRKLWRETKRRYRSGRREVCLTLTLEEVTFLEGRASERNQKLAEYIKSLFPEPPTTKALTFTEADTQALILSIRKISNNVNQAIRYVHSAGAIQLRDIELLRSQLAHLEALIADAVVSEHTIMPLIHSYLRQHPDKRTSLMRLIEISNDNKADTR